MFVFHKVVISYCNEKYFNFFFENSLIDLAMVFEELSRSSLGTKF